VGRKELQNPGQRGRGSIHTSENKRTVIIFRELEPGAQVISTYDTCHFLRQWKNINTLVNDALGL
jgi:hypothetical protein